MFMATTEHDGLFLRFKGEIFEINLSEWVLANTAPAMGELTVSSSAGKKHFVNCLLLYCNEVAL